MRGIVISLVLGLFITIGGLPSAEAQTKAKALVYFNGITGAIAACYNSTIAFSPQNVTPPCGFAATKFGTGDYAIDFKFKVDNHFFSIAGQPAVFTVCTDTNGIPACAGTTVTANQVEVITTNNVNLLDTKFYLIVF